MIHIIFGESASGSLKFALREMGLDRKDRVISFWDIFSIGPIRQLHEEEGMQSRFEWIKRNMSNEYDSDYTDYTNKFERVLKQINAIPEGEHVTIWAFENAHEQTGLQFVVYLLKEKNVDISLINTTIEHEKLFRVKSVKYSLLHTGEILPEKLKIIYEQSQGKLFTDHDREDLEKDWLSLADSQATLRIWRNGTVQSVPEEYYDEVIVKRAKKLKGKQKTNDFMKSARLIGEVLGYLDQYVGDAFLEYRLKSLIGKKVFESEGSLEAMRFYRVRLNR
ncbi:DUF1835 domain-containing protein [Niallia sp. Krafla_26]|uniref:DUF1835 domain-containing protein n=1 Tax=Niallia sp. Krafla_26 TaxID=3064703 RepID=UPI003D16250E